MARVLSVRLRRRVLTAIDGRISCRPAAARFGVSASSAIRWYDQRRRYGDIAPKPQGGDRRSGSIEAHAPLILAQVEARPDITLAELQAKLAAQGIKAGIGTLWRFFHRRRITLKNSPPMQPSKSAPTS